MLLTQLRNFLAVMDSGSIRGAARVLKVSQPALTRSIRQLEAELQAKLLERTARGVTPTPAGRAFLMRSRLVHQELGKAREELAQLAGHETGSVSFGVSPQAAIHIVPPAVAQFRLAHTDTGIRIMDGLPHLLLPLLRDGTLDFVIGPHPQAKSDAAIETHPLYTNRAVIGARRGHPLRKATSLRDLVDAQWVILSPPGLPVSIIPDVFEKYRLPSPKSVVRSDSYVAMLTLLAGTDLIGALTYRFFNERLARDFFAPFELKERLPEFTLCLFLRRHSALTPAAAAMVTTIKTVAKRIAFRNPPG
jgi:DNA-binding transcriptional LysR family regulator